MDFEKLFQSFSQVRVAVIGDVMLDTYWWGHVERISPEAPVPVVSLDKKEQRIGGAANVALNLTSLGARVNIFSVIGEDADGQALQDLLHKEKIGTAHLIQSTKRITTNKARIISRNQQMMRLDSETTLDLDAEDEARLLSGLESFLDKERPQVLIFEDYNKGVLSENVIRAALSLCRKFNVLTAVDPKKKNFFTYQGVDIFKPNLKEVREGLGLLLEQTSKSSLDEVHVLLEGKLDHKLSFITLSEKGVYFHESSGSKIIGSHMRNIADVSGAGDTVIAVASLVYAVTRDVNLMAEIANIAGGLVCEEVGTVAIDKEKLLAECKLLLPSRMKGGIFQ
jgi:rfaE bifunctional protein kinase chain/domain